MKVKELRLFLLDNKEKYKNAMQITRRRNFNRDFDIAEAKECGNTITYLATKYSLSETRIQQIIGSIKLMERGWRKHATVSHLD